MKLDYKLVHSNRRSIGITVERDRKIVVHAPQHASDRDIAGVVESKRLWIWQKVRDPHKYPDPAPRKEYVSGETFLYLGQQYSLSFVRRAGGKVQLVGTRFEIAPSDRGNGDALFRSWYLAQATELLRPRIATFATEMGVSYSRIWIRALRYRWGSYTPGGTLSFNWRIIQAPMIVVDYLIVHELAHALEPNHSHDFWNIVAIHVPGWRTATAWLKENGGRLEW